MKYPTEFRKEVWNAPDWVMKKGVSMSSGKAAKFLGMTRSTLIKHADDYGLTVIRRQSDRSIFFLVSELERLEKEIHHLSYKDIIKATKDKDYAILG